MAEHPIIFSGEMVRAILDGRKTQTRRVIVTLRHFGAVTEFGPSNTAGYNWHFRDRIDLWNDISTARLMECCPYGVSGDTLWLRERQRVLDYYPSNLGQRPDRIRVRYEADGQKSDWLPYPTRLKWMPVVGECLPYGGYRESSRITLTVTDVRVQRAQDISEEDAMAEGVTPGCPGHAAVGEGHICAFSALWDSLNAKRAPWASNCWVWAITFKRNEG